MSIKTKVGRIPAVQTCLDRSWANGTRLSSAVWKEDRKIADTLPVRLNPKAIQHLRVLLIRGDGTLRREEFLYSFPEDVQVSTHA